MQRLLRTGRAVARVSRSGAFSGGGGPAVFDPTSLALTGFWRGNSTTEYGSPTWTGTASAGSSGSRDLTEATNPPAAGATQNGHTPADYDGTNDRLANATAISTLLSSSAYFGWALFYADAISGTGPISTFFANEGLLADTGGFWGIHLTTVGGNKVQCAHWDGTAKGTEHAVSTGTWNLICFRYDGTNIRSKLNSGSVVTAAAGNISVTTGTLWNGTHFGGTLFYNGRILDMGLMAAAESDSRFDDIKQYINNRYALSL